MDLIQVTNLAYLGLALCMIFRNEPYATLVIIVFFVSALHHYFPSKKVLQRLDGTIANISLLLLLPHYLKRKQKTWHYWLSCETFALALYFYIISGDDFLSLSYVLHHSLWHVLSALALFIMTCAPDKGKVLHNSFSMVTVREIKEEEKEKEKEKDKEENFQ
jgi:hypothetical protein